MGRRAQTILLNASYAPSLVGFRGDLIRQMVAAGHRVHASAPGMAGSEEAIAALGATPHSVTLERAGLNPASDVRYCRQIGTLIKKTGADLVLNYTVKPNVWGSLAAARLGVRSASMVTGLGYTFIPGSGPKRRLISYISRQLYRQATRYNEVVIFQNADDRDEFIAAGCLADPAKARTINGSGVNLDHYRREPLLEQPVCLMIARLLINKGTREYGRAATEILGRRSDCRFLLAGFFDQGPDGINRDELKRWEAAGLEFLGELDDVRPALAAANVYVLPSYREGTPRTVLEAMAMGRPIITTDVPGCKETVEDGVNGLLIPARDHRALATAMERLIDDGEMRVRMGAASHALCREKYNVEQVNRAMMEYLSLDACNAPLSRNAALC